MTINNNKQNVAMTEEKLCHKADQTANTLDIIGSLNFDEFRDMVNQALNRDVLKSTSNDDAESQIESALLSLNPCDESMRNIPVFEEATASLTKYAPEVAESFNNAAQHLSLFYDNVVTSPSPSVGEAMSSDRQQTQDDQTRENVNSVVNNTVESTEETVTASCTIPKVTISNGQSQPKRHIMISYNRSLRETCKKIYDGLVQRDYKVWMDLTDMFDDILVGMARAIENSYIVLLCINQQYYESEYCRLEAEYAAENRVKFIPCLMEKEFHAESWLGIIKGSNVYIDFSSPDQFDQSFEDLVRQINYVEQKLAVQPRRTPGPGPVINPMSVATAHQSASNIQNSTDEANSRRFDAIIRQYKESIKKQNHHLNNLKRTELSELIVKLRQELFSETTQTLSDSERSDDDDEKLKTDDNLLKDLVVRSLQQNEVLLRLVDRLATPQPMNSSSRNHLDIDGIIKVIIAIMLLWTLNVLCQKE